MSAFTVQSSESTQYSIYTYSMQYTMHHSTLHTEQNILYIIHSKQLNIMQHPYIMHHNMVYST